MDEKTRSKAEALVREFLTGEILQKDVQNSEADGAQILEALKSALENPDTNDFDTGVVLAATLLREGAQLPEWLASFAADVLDGKRKRPTKRGQDKYANWQRDYIVARTVIEISSRFGVPEYTNNEMSEKVTAAQIVAESAKLSIEVVHHAIRKFGGIIRREISPQDKEV